MERNKKLAQTQILVTISVAIMTIGALIAAVGSIGFPLGWLILATGTIFFIIALVEFSKIK